MLPGLGRRSCQVAVLAMLAACGGVGRDDFVAAWIDADCERAARCGEYVSKEACVAHDHVTRAIDQDLLDLIQMVASPRISYDAGEGAACIERRRNASCDRTSADWRTIAASCAPAFRGEVPTGGVCYLDAECRDSACPARNCSEPRCCARTCAEQPRPAQRGESCSERPCVEGNFCNDFQVCTELLPAGSMCNLFFDCAYGLSCDGGVCENPPGRGESCVDGGCENWFGDRCAPASGTCERLATAGEPCVWGADCQLPFLCVSSVCVDPPEAGESCAEGVFCRSNAYCNGSVCVARRAEGEFCDSALECQTGHCDGATASASGICAKPPTCG